MGVDGPVNKLVARMGLCVHACVCVYRGISVCYCFSVGKCVCLVKSCVLMVLQSPYFRDWSLNQAS